MSKDTKIINRFLSHPKNFTFDELKKFLSIYGYRLDNKGRTSGSKVVFISDKYNPIPLHKPHKRNYLHHYQLKDVERVLKNGGLLWKKN